MLSCKSAEMASTPTEDDLQDNTDDEAGCTPEEVGLTVAEMIDQPRSVDQAKQAAGYSNSSRMRQKILWSCHCVKGFYSVWVCEKQMSPGNDGFVVEAWKAMEKRNDWVSDQGNLNPLGTQDFLKSGFVSAFMLRKDKAHNDVLLNADPVKGKYWPRKGFLCVHEVRPGVRGPPKTELLEKGNAITSVSECIAAYFASLPDCIHSLCCVLAVHQRISRT